MTDLAGDNEDEKAENDAMSKKCMKYKGNAAGDGRHANVMFDRSLPGTHSVNIFNKLFILFKVSDLWIGLVIIFPSVV